MSTDRTETLYISPTGDRYVATPTQEYSCEGCAFNNFKCLYLTIPCDGETREDGQDIIWVRAIEFRRVAP